MPYYDIVTSDGTDRKLNKKKDSRETLFKLFASNLYHFLQRWLCREEIPLDARTTGLMQVREYELKKRIGRTVTQWKHVKDYDQNEIRYTILTKGKK